MVRDWIRHVLNASEFRVVGVASSASEAVDLATKLGVADETVVL